MTATSLPADILAPIKALFFQECDELLASLDQGLNGLKRGDADGETINMIFRSVHSIKGGAANFDLAALAQFAHRVEMALSDLRSGKISAGKSVLDGLQLASDSLAELVEEARGGAPTDVAQSERALKALGAAPDISEGLAAHNLEPMKQPDPARTWQFRFQPNPSLYFNANDPIPLFRELGRLGEVKLHLDDRDLPDLHDLTPDGAYLAWSGTITTQRAERDLWNVFEFVGGDCDLEIALVQKEAQGDKPAKASGEARPLENKRVIRVDLERVDKLFNLVGELLVHQTIYSQFALRHPDPEAMPAYLEFERLSLEIQEGLLAIRSQSIKPIFQRMARLVRQLETATGKTVNFISDGEDAEVDRSVLEQLSEPLTHMIRNAVDHGLEDAAERARLGKDPVGTVRLSAYHRFGRIFLEVMDDGRGINHEKVRSKAIAKGLLSEQALPSEEDIEALILSPELSTSEIVTDISGRGVGMDVVNKSVRALGGRISIDSQEGVGTTFTLSLPLTLALMDGMVVGVGESLFVIPVAGIVESLQAQSAQIKAFGDSRLLRFRDEYLPLAELGKLLGYTADARLSQPVCLVVEDDLSNKAAFIVDEIVGRQQVVVKEIEGAYCPSHGLSGATILGDGRIALIVDVNDVVEALRSVSDLAKALVA